MSLKSLFSMDFLSALQDREAFFEKLAQSENDIPRMINFYVLLNLFGFLYGAIMGSYNGFMQAISSGLKIPLLFTLEIIICFPSFYIVQMILGSRLGFKQMLTIILTGFVLTATIALSFAPIVMFFFITGSNYYFLKLLHVGIFIFSGFFGMKTIVDALKFSCEKKGVYPKIGVQVFQLWIFILAFVGMQLSWNLRPFLGNKNMEFQWFRDRGGNFYVDVLVSTGKLMMPQSYSTPASAPKQIQPKVAPKDTTSHE